jgi:hypothetical protein
VIQERNSTGGERGRGEGCSPPAPGPEASKRGGAGAITGELDDEAGRPPRESRVPQRSVPSSQAPHELRRGRPLGARR